MSAHRFHLRATVVHLRQRADHLIAVANACTPARCSASRRRAGAPERSSRSIENMDAGLWSRAAGTKELIADSRGVFSTGAPAYNAFIDGGMTGATTSSSSASSMSGSPLTEHAQLDQEAVSAGSFVDRLGNWTDTPAGTMPAQYSPEPLLPSAAGVVAPEEVRRLSRVNESNAGSVFTSGSAPVPYLPSTPQPVRTTSSAR